MPKRPKKAKVARIDPIPRPDTAEPPTTTGKGFKWHKVWEQEGQMTYVAPVPNGVLIKEIIWPFQNEQVPPAVAMQLIPCAWSDRDVWIEHLINHRTCA